MPVKIYIGAQDLAPGMWVELAFDDAPNTLGLLVEVKERTYKGDLDLTVLLLQEDMTWGLFTRAVHTQIVMVHSDILHTSGEQAIRMLGG